MNKSCWFCAAAGKLHKGINFQNQHECAWWQRCYIPCLLTASKQQPYLLGEEAGSWVKWMDARPLHPCIHCSHQGTKVATGETCLGVVYFVICHALSVLVSISSFYSWEDIQVNSWTNCVYRSENYCFI